MAKRLGWIELFVDSAGEHRWRVIAGNGRVTDVPGEGFASRSNARRAAIKQHPELADRVRTVEHLFK